MKQTLSIVFFVIFLSIFGCVSTGMIRPGVVVKKHAKFGVDVPSVAWTAKSFRGADMYFLHQETGATIFLNSQCEDIKDSPLEALRAQILIGFENINVDKEERINLGERQALVSEIRATMDGVPQFLKVMVLRKNRCIFDAVLSSSTNNPDLIADFDKMLATFWAEAEL